jgi:hypothetical protein
MTRQVHTSRAQQARTATPIHEDSELLLDDVGPLPDIAPRPGYAQRWIGTSAKRLMTASRRGWLPRDPSTVSKSMQMMTIQHEGLGGVIGTHDLVLMERPEEIQRRVEHINRQKVRNLEIAVSQSLGREHERLREEGSGIRPGRFESQARVERGAMPIAQDED